MKRRHMADLQMRVRGLETVIDKIDRTLEKIEIVTLVREPSTPIAVDAYNGLRKQVVAAAAERSAHLYQLAQFDVALRSGVTPEQLAELVGDWCRQAEMEVVEDATVEEAFELVGDGDAPGRSVIQPAYVDARTGRVVRSGVAERVAPAEPSAPIQETVTEEQA
jgi:hypothetical protein